MERYLKTILPLVAVFFLRRAFMSNPTDEGAATAGAHPQHSVQYEVIGVLARRFADARLSEDAISLIFLAASIFAAAVGYVCHLLLDDRAFGPKINGVLCFFGAAIAVFGWIFIAPKSYAGNPQALLMVSSVGAVCFLLLFAIIKAALMARFDEVASGARPMRVRSRGRPPESRMNAIISRRQPRRISS